MPAPERETSSVELLWDLVFVFAVTQVTTLLAAQPSWGRFAHSMLVLALIWWAWSAFVWASNALEADSRLLRGHLLLATILIFIAGLALPRAFGNEAILFAGAYVLVRMVHMKLYIDAARAGRAGLGAILGFATTTGVGMGLLIIGALAGGWSRDALWAVAVTIDYAGPAWLTRERLRGLQRVAVAHFADRYGDFVIICLGESIVSVGVGVADSEHPLSVTLVATAALGLLTALGMWWTYFDSIAGTARERLGSHGDPVLAAADSYSYLHLLIVAGVIIYASGIRMVVHNRWDPRCRRPAGWPSAAGWPCISSGSRRSACGCSASSAADASASRRAARAVRPPRRRARPGRSAPASPCWSSGCARLSRSTITGRRARRAKRTMHRFRPVRPPSPWPGQQPGPRSGVRRRLELTSSPRTRTPSSSCTACPGSGSWSGSSAGWASWGSAGSPA